jgi:hypothetical protein
MKSTRASSAPNLKWLENHLKGSNLKISKEERLPTGNDVVAIPSLSAADASAQEINVLSMKYCGLVEFHGTAKAPFFKPLIKIGAKTLDLGKEKQLEVERLEHWVPEFDLSDGKTFAMQLKVIAPLSARGFVLDYSVKNLGSKPLKIFLGAEGSLSGLRLRSQDAQAMRLWRKSGPGACLEFTQGTGLASGKEPRAQGRRDAALRRLFRFGLGSPVCCRILR